ncbi:MAG: HD domain-containing protein [Candidatus Eremiobacteraeota bacterium]|nr:HD domain-containing protein [Candidatus Eremiobacteraeota bacterium]
MNRYPGERAAFAELLSIVRDETRFEDRWAIVDFVRREMHAASPEEITALVDRASTQLAACVPASKRRTVLARLDALRERTQEIVWEQASVRGTTPEDLVDAMHEMIRAIDPTLLLHLSGVGTLAGRIAKHLGLQADRVSHVAIAGRLVDVGKAGLPRDAHADEHCALGERMVRAIPALQRYAGWIRAHHERLDGSGYPDALRSPDIPLEVRILSVADVFTTMVNAPYHSTRMHETLAHLSNNAGTLYDPLVVGALEELLTVRRLRPTSTAA